jgi:hypothetical protein
MNSVYVDGIYIGNTKNLKAVSAGGTHHGVLAIGGEV